MRWRYPVAVVGLSMAMSSVCDARGDILSATVTLLVGRPPAPGAAETGVVILPGTVVLPGEVSSGTRATMEQLKLKLIDNWGLAELATRSVRTMFFVAGQERELASPSPDVGIRLRLVAFDDKVSTYTVSLTEGGKPLATPTVVVERGGRAVVGSRDGEEAPYMFLVIEPAPAESKGAQEVEKPLPKLVSKVNPEYPEEARKEKIVGLVVMEVTVDEQGRVADVQVIDSASDLLSEAAAKAVRQWRYEPPRVEGKPASVTLAVTVRFALE